MSNLPPIQAESAFLNSREACTSAAFAAYPARTAACLPFRSMRYSSTKRACLGVSMAPVTWCSSRPVAIERGLDTPGVGQASAAIDRQHHSRHALDLDGNRSRVDCQKPSRLIRRDRKAHNRIAPLRLPMPGGVANRGRPPAASRLARAGNGFVSKQYRNSGTSVAGGRFEPRRPAKDVCMRSRLRDGSLLLFKYNEPERIS